VTEGDMIMEGVALYWEGVFEKVPLKTNAGLDIIGLVLDWREDQAMLKTVGSDGAA
jgi:hypothetical protein